MLRKIAEIKVPKGAGPREAKTNPIFATYDRQGAAFAFFFSDSNIARATANLLFMVDGQKVFVDDGVTLGETNETHTFTYPLPDKLLNYTGKVDGYLYFDFEDGSHSDEIHFVFTIKKSRIDEEVGDAPDVYIKSFEDAKAEVQEAADGAKETISQKVTEVSDTSDSAISKANQAADGATESITTAADSIDKVKSNAEATISDHVSSVGSAKEAAEKRINDASGEVETAKVEAVKSMSELDISDKNYLLDSKKRVLEPRTSGRPEDNSNYDAYFLSEPIQAGVEFTVSGQLEITDGDFDTISIKFRDENDENIGASSFYVEHSGNEFSETFTLSQTAYRMYIYAGKTGETRGNGVIYENVKLQPGSIATPWTPNPSEIMTQKQYDKIAKAITSLGGSI